MDKRLTFILAALCALVLLGGCISAEKEKEKEKEAIDFDIYDPEEFADILFDLTLVESAYRLNMADPAASAGRSEIYQSILAQHKTDTLTFDANWTYYGGEPEDMAEVYDLVLGKIEQERISRGAQPSKKEEDFRE